jgi:hypothetical protein
VALGYHAPSAFLLGLGLGLGAVFRLGLEVGFGLTLLCEE